MSYFVAPGRATALDLTPTRVTAQFAALTRQLGGGMQADCGAIALSLTLAPAASLDAAGSDEALVFDGPHGAVTVQQGVRLLRALTGIDLSSAAMQGPHWAWLEAAALARLRGTPLAFAQTVRLAAPDAAPDTGADGDLLALALSLEDAGQRGAVHRIVTRASASVATWRACLADPLWRAVPRAALSDAFLPNPQPVLLARHRLPLALLQTLRPGDIVLPDHPYFDCAGAGLLSLGAQRLGVQFHAPRSLIITAMEQTMDYYTASDYETEPDYPSGHGAEHPAHYQENHQADFPAEHQDYRADQQADYRADHQADYQAGYEAQPPAAPLAPPAAEPAHAEPRSTSVEQLPLSLDFVLGQLNLNLGQMRQLAPGVVLELGQGTPASIGVMCGGRLLGRGEAVNVDGKLGVRLTEWTEQA
ncbi:type III secretion system cytoplasmic ring protein SctQ [Janthinobacterium agaricidamnosum]|uniref:Flagellar motor switch protein FliN-like C-terminal domain-containing protein n=1 Tax=Janthinobacterium agaricidamnosum NBRC 102515 = DSM 9628 TaxID=1349767 RepID=W0V4V3_9BURK|nr:type III secretion system cytoplasmic ring protein SctQ [Janthinobacterium agaricidamnosum]CDG82302.1 conserved hypothetical protein [Janthinobacterium agaricidamnosum NBRC 102515 = DSM 9628]